jgi:ABC-type glycerol-3-phosphate transport system substrate-binding protein
MKFTRRATTVSVAVAGLLAVCAGLVSSAAAKSGSAGATVTINVAALRPGSSSDAQ